MSQTITVNDLVKYIYKETNIAETLAIREALQSNYSLYQQYHELMFSLRQLPKAKFDVAPSAIDNILRYSKQTTVETL